MDKTAFRALALGAVLALAPSAASAYMCRDEKGSTSYQEEPCPERKGTSGVAPVTANELNEKAMQETMRRFTKAAKARDSAAAMSLMSRNLKATLRSPEGKAKAYDYSKYYGYLKSAYDGSQSSVTYKCKAATATTAGQGALLCEVTGEGMSGSKRVKLQNRDTIEFALELGEVKIVSIDSTSISRSEEGRF